MSNEPLIVRHRPADFDQVRGHTETVAALRRRIRDPGRPHAYLFTGPSGVGKTTLARIVGTVLEAEVIEVDAASNNGVDAMRALVELGHYLAPGAQARLIILDECHMLSRNAWNAVLKVLEEPPAHLYLALCTTELHRVPETIVTRCHPVKLDRLDQRQIADFLVDVVEAEGWHDMLPDVFTLVVQEAQGSPRQALSLLQAVYDAPSPGEARRIISLQGSASPLIQVLQVLMSGQGGWSAIRPLLAQLGDDDFSEQSLILASRYLIGALNREESEKRAARLWEILSAFLYPVHSYDPRSVFYGAVGRILWSEV